MNKINFTEKQTTFGGLVYLFDYCTDFERSKNLASRIASDLRFDQQCKRNYETRERMRENV